MNTNLALLLAGGLLVASCGGSSSQSTPEPLPVVTPDIVTVGPITGFGSVVSNGITFNTDAASVTMDGELATVADLRIGMVVSIRGTINAASGTAEANSIRFSDDAEGPISSIDRGGNSFVVLGRTVFVDELTAFDDASFDSLTPGNVVQVSGQWRSQERIQATHVHRIANAWAAGMTMEVKGTVSGLDAANRRFNIGAQTCDYSMASLELDGAELADGLYVEVSSTSPMSDGDMVLDRVRLHDHDRDRERLCDSGCDFEIEGFVTSFTSATEFMVDGQAVTTTASTIYVNGTVDTLALDVKLAVDGTLDESGVLVADRIVFRLPSLIEIDADIESIDEASAAVTLLGIAVTTNESTLFRDRGPVSLVDFGFDDLAVGDRVKVRAYLDEALVVATRVERDDPDDIVILKAPVENVDRPSVTLLGIVVTADQNTVFQNEAKIVVDADTFFALVETGSIVRAEGTYDGASILAQKMFLRDCQDGCL